MNKSFSLIEIMIVISIIALLTTLGLNTYSGFQTKARDTRRKADLNTINQALNAYYAVNGKYPDTTGPFWYYSTSGSTWIPQLVTGKFIDAVPQDPINNAAGPWELGSNNYSYAYHSTNIIPNNQSYDLVARLEDNTDPDRCGVKQYKWYDGRFWCSGAPGSNYSPQLYDASPLRF